MVSVPRVAGVSAILGATRQNTARNDGWGGAGPAHPDKPTADTPLSPRRLAAQCRREQNDNCPALMETQSQRDILNRSGGLQSDAKHSQQYHAVTSYALRVAVGVRLAVRLASASDPIGRRASRRWRLRRARRRAGVHPGERRGRWWWRCGREGRRPIGRQGSLRTQCTLLSDWASRLLSRARVASNYFRLR
jgi:hypothetical protein